MLGNIFEGLQNEATLVLVHRISQIAISKLLKLSCQQLSCPQIPGTQVFCTQQQGLYILQPAGRSYKIHRSPNNEPYKSDKQVLCTTTG
jgi:hypothetical protein